MRMLRPNISYLSEIYYFRFFYQLGEFFISTSIKILVMMSHDDKSILHIYLTNVFAKIQ